jgi:hypothetical protein
MIYAEGGEILPKDRILADQKRPIEDIRHFIGKKDHYGNDRLLAQIETEYGNYEEAIALYKKQIESRTDSYWSDEPRNALMEIYKLQGNTSSYNDELYKMMLAHPETGQYFLEYKALFSEDEWEEKWEEILLLFEESLSRINVWLSIEGRYDLIMENAEPDQEYVIEEFEQELFKLYPVRCFRVLSNAADREARNSSNRREYRRVARILRKIAAHPGGQEIAANLADKYRQQYPRRPAMIDELKRF